MSREQATSFKKHRDAEDPQGNLGWAARVQNKSLRCGPEAMERIDVESEFELTETERIVWRILKIPRKYMDVEHAGLMPVDKLRGFLRGLVAADVLDIVEQAEGKALVPAEVRRIKAEIEGKQVARPSGVPLKAKVYRPDISGAPPESATPAEATRAPSSAGHTPSRPFGAPQTTPARATAAPTGPVILNDDERALKAEIDAAYQRMQKQSHYEFLGVGKTADDSVIRAAYVQHARVLHPDRVAGTALQHDRSAVEKIDALFKRLQEAQAALATADTRSVYDRTLEALGASGAQQAHQQGGKQRRPLEAQNALKMGDAFFKRKDYKQAEAHYRQAATFDGEEPKVLTALAYCIWLNPDHPEDTRTADARKRLNEVVQKYKHADAAYKLGLLLRKLGEDTNAMKYIKMAAHLDPGHLEATREVRLFTMRADEKKADERGLFGKLLKK